MLPDLNPGSPAAFQQAKKWLDECMNSGRHPKCNRSACALPKRVVDLGETPVLSDIRLYITKREVAPYVTLSYKWGDSHPLRTRDGNLEERCKDVRLEDFPQTLKDALFITKKLGFRYIWIDCLCIIQGNKQDWSGQSQEMTSIYNGSTLNISATSSKSHSAGILNKRPEQMVRVGTWFELESENWCEVISAGRPLRTLDLEEKEISARGWVFQERLVSPATLHYTDEGLLWECGSDLVPEHRQSLSSVKWKENWKNIVDRKAGTDVQIHLVKRKRKTNDPRNSWKNWLCAYSERELFDHNDKFPAMAGVAKAFAETFNLRYAAGLWREDIFSGLTWSRFNRTKTLLRFNDEYVAPSWSPFSVQGRLKYRHVNLFESEAGSVLQAMEVEVEEERPGTFGRVKFGKITAKGLLQRVVLDRSLHPFVREKDFQECGVAKGFKNNINVYCMLDEYDESFDQLYPCWCLRLGSYDADGRVADMFLLLEKVDLTNNEFRRVGLAETDAWNDVMKVTPNSSILSSKMPTVVVLV